MFYSADWYQSLPLEARIKIKKIGNKPGSDSEFYPDTHYE